MTGQSGCAAAGSIPTGCCCREQVPDRDVVLEILIQQMEATLWLDAYRRGRDLEEGPRR